MSDLQTEVTTEEGRTVLRMVGQLDTQSCVMVEKALVDLIEGGDGNVEVDLSELGYINSPGVGVFFDAHRRAKEKGGSLILNKPTERVREIFDLLGLGAVMEIRD
jgi:anti-sigma B factor antagonist